MGAFIIRIYSCQDAGGSYWLHGLTDVGVFLFLLCRLFGFRHPVYETGTPFS